MKINNYLVEEITRRVVEEIISEARPRNVGDDIIKYKGRKPKRLGSRIRQIKQKIEKYGLTSRRYTDEEKVLKEYEQVITSFGCQFYHDGGRYVNVGQSGDRTIIGKQYTIKIVFEEGSISGFITLIGYGEQDSPFSEFETHFSLINKTFESIEK